MNQVMRKLIDSLDYSKIRATPTPEISNAIPAKDTEDMAEGITHSYFWPRIGQWLREYDVVITETGTASFGILETRFPAHITNISQVLYGSIGYSVGALQGAALASKETQPDRRVILFVGDGSLQLTVQEIATVIRHGLKPIMYAYRSFPGK
jgi:pyruvate decarboxylase